MLIRVRYNDNTYDMVRPELLDHLLEMGTVAGFQRRDGWVARNSPAVRSAEETRYLGADRREKHSFEYDM